MTSELLQQVRLLDPVSATDRVADVLIEGDRIAAVAEAIVDYPHDAHVQDCRDLVLGPGLVDLYSHSGEPGFEERETLASLLQAARAGGFTRIALLPDTDPPLDSPGGVAWLQSRWQDVARLSDRGAASGSVAIPQLYCWAALTQGVQGQQMTELGELAEVTIAGFADGRALSNLLLVRRLLEYLRPLGQPVALWAMDSSLSGNGVMREGEASIRFGLPGVPAIAETSALSALLECIAAIGTPVHLMRISTARGVALIQAAKDRGLPVTASTTWMHLRLNTEAIGSYDPSLHLAPPLGNPDDQEALIQAVCDGVIDAIAIDHTPYTYEEKTVAFAEAPPGAIGLELALPILWQQLVETGRWSALDLWRSLSTQPARCLQTKPATIAPGEPAELTLFHPQQCWLVDPRSLHSLATNTPWLGQEIVGQVVRTWSPHPIHALHSHS